MKIIVGKLSILAVLICIITLVSVNRAWGFDFQNVVKKAKQRASKPYSSPKSAPKFLTDLTYDQYRKIYFKPKNRIWHQKHSSFQIGLISPGSNYKHIVNINLVNNHDVHKVDFNKKDFSWPDKKIAKKVPKNMGLAGFRLTYPLNTTFVHDQFLVFAGMSYFRGVGRKQNFGLSSRGITIDTGLSSGEKFPSFTDFWLRYPGPEAKRMQFYALLDGKSLTGAYQFTVIPGKATRVKVKAILFMRKKVKMLGIAPLTSMFYYGRNTPRPANRWRGAIHDSDGLLMNLNSGEWLWHPLINPEGLEMEYFTADSLKGFGLMQRGRNFNVYNDAQARYDKRPSTWVNPHSSWGKGKVVLVKIPTQDEYNDNIVAFWTPDKKLKKGDSYTISYTLSFGKAKIAQEPTGKAESTFVGNPDTNQYRFIVNFSGGPLTKLKSDAKVKAVVSTSGEAKILDKHVQWIAPLSQWRMSILVKAVQGKKLHLRGHLKSKSKTLTETWSYTLPPKNRMNSNGK